MRIIREDGEPPFKYRKRNDDKIIEDPQILEYISKLVIPPKYKSVNIFISIKDGKPTQPPKLTYTGIDEAGRTQYGYSDKWKKASGIKKFKSLLMFGRALPKIRTHVKKRLSDTNPKIDMDFCISLIVAIIGLCHFRVGSIKNKELYQSYGISTIEKKHVNITKDKAIITFIGKKAVKNRCAIKDKVIINHLARLTAGKSPKDPVFMYTFEDCVNVIKATDINMWFQQFSKDVTSKMFRTFSANSLLISILMSKRILDSPNKRKKTLNSALDEVADTIHNTRTVCKKEYVHPKLIELYLEHPRKFKKSFEDSENSDIGFLQFLQSA